MKKKLLSILLATAMLMTTQGTVTGGSEVESTGATAPANPVHHCTKENGGRDYTEWSYVYFGSYPQTEVTGAALTAAITGADYDANGDAWVNGTKYRRASKSDANNTEYFGSSAYRYFKWKRIKWRVLGNNGSTLFVVADQGLDCKNYHDPGTSTTWENCTLRTWLNETFYNTAFSSSEQGAIVQQAVVNDNSPAFGTPGGNNTQDNVYLLSLAEVKNPEYGLCERYKSCSASRWMQPSDYAHAMGVYTDSSSNTGGNDNCWWLLRSPGYSISYAAHVDLDGYVDRYGSLVNDNRGAAVPVLQINLSSALWYTTDDGTSGEAEESGTIEDTAIEQGNAKYTITDTAKKTVEYTAPTSKNQKNVTIPASIEVNNTAYTITSIAANAFKGNKNLTKVTIGKNVTTIGKQAFHNCKKLKKVTVKTTGLTAKSVGAKAFKGISKKAVIKVPAKKLSAYKKMLKKKGITGKAQKIKK